MLIAYNEIQQALRAALSARGFEGVEPQLMAIEAPRAWGVTSNVCFTLAGKAAAEDVARETAGLSKGEAKKRASEITRAAGEKLAREIAAELAGSTAVPGRDSSALESRKHEATGRDARAPEDTGMPFIREITAEGAYINLYYDADALARHVVDAAVRAGTDFGKGAVVLHDGRPKRIMVEYAQPNTHKDFHVGHLRNASIGQAIANLLEFAGNEVLKATYIGDVGAHIVKALTVFRNLGHLQVSGNKYFFQDNLPDRLTNPLGYWQYLYSGKKLLDDIRLPTQEELAALPESEREPTYLFHEHLISERDRMYLETLSLWEKGDLEIRTLVDDTTKECIGAFRKILNELNIEFTKAPDCWFFESTVDDTKLGQKAAEELKRLNLATIDTEGEYKGALFVDFAAQADTLKPDGTPVFRDSERKRIKQLGKMTILRSDGTSLYQTKELGLAKYKFDNFAIDESLYVVGAEQKLYFEQVFAILRLWGFPNAENCKHISYELVVLPEGKMSSREGNIVSYRELRDEAVKRAEAITREKGIAGDVEKTAKDIAIAATKYTMLAVTGSQQITFDFEQALSFDGRSAPYLQYAYARTRTLVEGMDSAASGAGVSARQPYPVPAAPLPPSTEGQGPRAEGQEEGRGNRDEGIEEEGISDRLDTPMPVGQASGLSLTRSTGETPAPPEEERAGTPALPEEPRPETAVLQDAALHPSEIALARCISRFPDVVQEAAAKYEPATLCTYLYDLAGLFAEFYRDCRVLNAPPPQREFRQRLTLAFRNLMAAGFKLLALPLPEEM